MLGAKKIIKNIMRRLDQTHPQYSRNISSLHRRLTFSTTFPPSVPLLSCKNIGGGAADYNVPHLIHAPHSNLPAEPNDPSSSFTFSVDLNFDPAVDLSSIEASFVQIWNVTSLIVRLRLFLLQAAGVSASVQRMMSEMGNNSSDLDIQARILECFSGGYHYVARATGTDYNDIFLESMSQQPEVRTRVKLPPEESKIVVGELPSRKELD
ncbi:hypothetical protein RND71_018211 [Anisodus tanguticus]|uniref:Uncharacterized protein n=1 Tax=Anisodus tanguticus TaxID=243964 RepID=A0AAE1S3S5_9SOLA|nr:hypothetical protein RND71_018211 [Anisodus tanguticus]